MNIPPIIKSSCNFIFDKFSNDLGNMIIYTTIVGWLASSAAQIIGIATNKKYTKEEKSFMIPQEIADASVNIGAYILLTTPIKKFASKLVSTCKVTTPLIKNSILAHGDVKKMGKLDFDVTKCPYFKNDSIGKAYNSFHNFMSTAGALVGGVLSSNIVTPILRNRLAASQHAKIIQKYPEIKSNYKKNIKTVPQNYSIKQPSSFDIMRHSATKI